MKKKKEHKSTISKLKENENQTKEKLMNMTQECENLKEKSSLLETKVDQLNKQIETLNKSSSGSSLFKSLSFFVLGALIAGVFSFSYRKKWKKNNKTTFFFFFSKFNLFYLSFWKFRTSEQSHWHNILLLLWIRTAKDICQRYAYAKFQNQNPKRSN